MISFLSGTLHTKDLGSIILDVNGVGYRVHVSTETFATLPVEVGSPVSLHTHLAVRENSMELFGFATTNELTLFEMLINVPGIGPKSALAVLSLATSTTLRTAIGRGDTTYLTKVSGIGKKTAEKIVVELKDRIGAPDIATPELREDADVIEALVSLGYTQQSARDAVKKIDNAIVGTSERVKEAMKQLNTRNYA
ncbi:MAG: Holliday junction branch migration protein RuvA [Patescibacteria group bacterium]